MTSAVAIAERLRVVPVGRDCLYELTAETSEHWPMWEARAIIGAPAGRHKRTLPFDRRWRRSTFRMADVTQILASIERGDPHAAEQLLPLVYEELRKLAAVRLARENPGQTLQPTALVHEAYLRLVEGAEARHWDSRGHFFSAAAEAMRRILVDAARRRNCAKRGGDRNREPLDEALLAAPDTPADLLALDEALVRFEAIDPRAAELVKLRYFGGLTVADAAKALRISPRTADDLWAYARAWLYRELQGNSS